jgi:hypothetical protein
MILKLKSPIPEYACEKLKEVPFDEGGFRRCMVSIPEEYAITYVHPESFDFSDVYGDCEFSQMGDLPVVVSKFQFEKNVRSFEQESIAQQTKESPCH